MRHDAERATGFGWNVMDRFRPAAGAKSGPILLPALRAYSGVRVAGARGDGLAAPLGRLGQLEIRLAHKAKEVREAQKLRYRVFYQEMSAIPDASARLSRRDVDAFDAICEHLLVLDYGTAAHRLRRGPRVVGTYRMLRQQVAERHGGFYSAGEYDVAQLVAGHRGLRFLEVGRSCVLAPYRNKRTVELLWHGIWSYVIENRMDVMFGCASLEGTDPDQLALVLSYLHHFHAAPEAWRAAAVRARYVPMDRLAKGAVDARAAWHALPPLIKGYLRLGAFIGDGAVIDYEFGTTDVLIVLPVAAISARYIQHFGSGAERYAA
jgi:putative hemolysin